VEGESRLGTEIASPIRGSHVGVFPRVWGGQIPAFIGNRVSALFSVKDYVEFDKG